MTLIERLEKLDGPSREVDAEIAKKVGLLDANLSGDDLAIAVAAADEFEEEHSPPRYTESVDAALTLKPEVWRVFALQEQYLSVSGGYGGWVCGLDRVGPGEQVISEKAPTPAIALCIAALRARDHD